MLLCVENCKIVTSANLRYYLSILFTVYIISYFYNIYFLSVHLILYIFIPFLELISILSLLCYFHD